MSDYALGGGRRSPGDVGPLLTVARATALDGGLEVQLMRAEMVFGRDHLVSAIEHARRAFKVGTNMADSLAVEVLLYASGRRQIAEALRLMGLRPGTTTVAVVVLGRSDLGEVVEDLGMERDDGVLEGRIDALEEFGIGSVERETVPADGLFDLVLERVALVELFR